MHPAIRISSLAEAEINEAYRWYAQRELRVALRLLDEINHSVQLVLDAPLGIRWSVQIPEESGWIIFHI